MWPVRLIAACASIAILTLIAALPWSLPPQDRFFLPMLPAVAIHFWGLRHPALVPEWFAFATGLVLDVLTHGPLGYWALINLTAHLIAVSSAPYAGRGWLALLGLRAAALLIVTIAAWGVASCYFLQIVDVWPYVLGSMLAAAGSAVLIPLLHLLDPNPGRRDNVRLERGV